MSATESRRKLKKDIKIVSFNIKLYGNCTYIYYIGIVEFKKKMLNIALDTRAAVPIRSIQDAAAHHFVA